jgi:ribose transport system substrate-binding protein
MRNTPLRVGLITAAAGLLMLAAACTSATDKSATGDSSSGASSSQSACAKKAQAVVDKARAPLPLAVPTATLDGSKMAGKNIWVISILSNQWTQDVNSGLKKAAKDLGIDLTIFDGQGQVDKWNQGIQQAIADKADGIIMNSIDPAVVSQAVADAAAAHIPVLNAMSAKTGAPTAPGIFANMQADNYTDGYNTAAWMIADSDCKADALVMYASGVVVWDAQQAGANQAFEDLCPTTCKVTTKVIDLANIATDMPRQTQTELTKDKDIDYVYPVQDSAVPFIEPAITQINPSVKIVSRDGVSSNLDALRGGSSLQKVDVSMPAGPWFGYAFIDDISRAVLGMTPSGVQVPTMLIDKSNIVSSNDDLFPAYSDYEGAYKKVWGVN